MISTGDFICITAPKPPNKADKPTADALSTITTQIKDLQLHFNKRCDTLQERSRIVDGIRCSRRLRLTLPVPSSSPTGYHTQIPTPILPSAALHHGSSSSSLAQLLPSASSPTGIPKPPKIHLPPFDGSHTLDWIFQSEQFFDFSNVPPDQRLSLLPFYQGDAFGWFHWLRTNNMLSTWDAFIRALKLCFGPSALENPQVALFNSGKRLCLSAPI